MSSEDVIIHQDHDDDTEGVVVAKGVAMAVLFSASMICGLFPLVLSRKFKLVSANEAGDLKSSNKIVMTLLSFGGGVLLATTFMHLMPEIQENVHYLQGKLLIFLIIDMYSVYIFVTYWIFLIINIV